MIYEQRIGCTTYSGNIFSPENEIEVMSEITSFSYPNYIRFVSNPTTLTKKKRVSDPKIYACLAGYSASQPGVEWLVCNAGEAKFLLSMCPIGVPQPLHTDGAQISTGNSLCTASFYTEKSGYIPYLYYIVEDIIPEARNLSPSLFVDETKAAEFSWEFYAEIPENGIPLVQKSAVLQWKSEGGTVNEIVIDGAAQTYSFPANTFAEKKGLQWRVQVTSDDDITSEWSEWQYVSTVENAGTVSNIHPSDMLVNGEITNRVSWKYENEFGTEQSAYDLEMSTNGVSWILLSSETTKNQYCDVSAGTFVTERVWIRVRAYNSSGIPSEWATASFTVRSSPPKPSIVSVSANVDKPVISWESTGQEAYEISVFNADGVVVYSKAVSGTEKHHKVALRLDDGSYTVSLNVKNKYNLTSPTAQRAFEIFTEKPDKPSLYATHSNGTVTVILSQTTDHSVLLRNGIVIADVSGLTEYNDHTAYGACTYTLRALAEDSFCDSELYDVTVSFAYALISASDNHADSLLLRFKAGSAPENGVSYSAESASLNFAGRQYPVTEFGERRALSKNLSYSVFTEQELQKLMSFVGKIVLWRDTKDKLYGSLSDISFARHRSYIDVSFVISKQDVSEEISYE